MRLGERVEESQIEQEAQLDKQLPPMARKQQTQEGKHSGRSLIPEQVPGGSDGSRDSACRPPHCDNPSRSQLSWRIPAERGRRMKLPIHELFYGPSFEPTQFIVPSNSILIRGARKEICHTT